MSKDQELYNEEQRQLLIDINKSLEKLSGVFSDKIQVTVKQPESMTVSGGLEVTNPVEEVGVKNLSEVTESLDELKTKLTEAIKGNKPIETIEVKNIADAKADKVKITNLDELNKSFKALESAINKIEPIVNVQKQELTWPTSANKPIAVRLSDGKSFYNAMAGAITAMSNPGETDPLVGYQPSDVDDDTSTKYFGFVKKDGRWYIMRQSSTDTFRYAKGAPLKEGGGLYIDAWTNRANLTYSYFYEVF